MGDAYTDACAGGAARSGDGSGAAIGAARWLFLAAAPTFAIMALLNAVLSGESRPEALCGAGQHASVLGGMVPMYLLMSAFHSAPWLRLVSSRWRRAGRV